jgi:hypothetical protein
MLHKDFMPTAWNPGLLLFISSHLFKLSQTGIKGGRGKLRSFAGPSASSIELTHHEMQHFCKCLDDPPVEFIEAVEERHYFQEGVLQQSKVVVTSADI